MWVYNVCHANNSVGNFGKRWFVLWARLKKNVILIDNFVQSLHSFCTYYFNPTRYNYEYRNTASTRWFYSNTYLKSKRSHIFFSVNPISLRRINRMNPVESFGERDWILQSSSSSYFSRVTTQEFWIWSILAVTFGHLLPRTPARIQPRDQKRGRWGHWSRGKVGRRGRRGEKGRIRSGEKEAEKKNTTHPADGGRPVRLVLDLKPREYPPSFFSLSLRFPPFASTRIPPAVASFSEGPSLYLCRHHHRFRSAFKGVACYRPGGCNVHPVRFIFTLATHGANFPLIGSMAPPFCFV